MKIAIIGLGYVGLPLAVEFGKKNHVVGFDINDKRVAELQSGQDRTLETNQEELRDAKYLSYTSDSSAIAECNIFIVTIPTPINDIKRPDFGPLLIASQAIGKVLKKGDVVIYESTVFPGATEEICVPELEKFSDLKFNIDFTVGYSPERINPGDKQHRLTSITKITSGSTPEAAEFVDSLYRGIITAGTHKASSIKVAEAAKVIENIQRDVNIALMNEFSLIFNRLGIDTNEVLEASSTKWNFLPYKPGLVGGNCISVDPYYLIQKAELVGYTPDILHASRRVNDSMSKHIATEVIKLIIQKGLSISSTRILVLGFSFKENCGDIRNTRVFDLVLDLESFGAKVDIYDPWVDRNEAKHLYKVDFLAELPESGSYDAVIVAVAHDQFKSLGIEGLHRLVRGCAVIYDVKGLFPKGQVDGRL